MALRFLHAADIHLDSPLHGLQRYEGAPVEAIRTATRQALQNLVNRAIEHAVQFVVISGDLYDGNWRDYNTGLYFLAQAQRLSEAGIPLVLISGNHDAQNVMTRSLRFPAGTTMLSHQEPETKVFEDLGVAVHGQSFAHKAVTEDLSLRYPQALPGLFNLGLLHTSATGREGHDNYAPCTIAGLLARGYHYWALGHVHQREVLLPEPWIAFAGNVQGRHIRESGPKGCYLVDVDSSWRIQTQFLPLDVFRWNNVTIPLEGIANEDDLWPLIEQALKQVDDTHEGRPGAVRMTLTGRTAMHHLLVGRRDAMIAEIRNQAREASQGRLWVEKVRLTTQPSATSLPAAGAETPRQELLDFIQRLRQSPDVIAILGSDVTQLCQKLGGDLNKDSAGLNFDDPATWQNLLDEAQDLVLARLAGAEGAE